jgi:hypothetical protein
MKRLLLGCLALTAVFLTARTLNAAPVVITDTTRFMEDRTFEETDLLSFGGDQVNALQYPLDWVGWTHHLELLPPASQIVSATLTLSVIDDDPDLHGSSADREYGLAVLEDGTWGFSEVSTFAYTFQIDISSLLDQSFSAFVYSFGGDFIIESSTLEILYNPVPVPSTIVLLASSSFALMVLRRRRRKT